MVQWLKVLTAHVWGPSSTPSTHAHGTQAPETLVLRHLMPQALWTPAHICTYRTSRHTDYKKCKCF